MTDKKDEITPAVMKKVGLRLGYIDALRGASSMLVVISHAYIFFTINHLFINFGKIGVFVFFLISGFVIPFSFKKSPGNYKIFITSRFFRLYPAYWASIVIALSVYFIFDNTIPPTSEIISNITMLQMGMGKKNIIGVYWTLFIELIFYVICIFLAWKKILWDERKMINMFYVFILLSVAISVARFILHKKFPAAIPLGLSLMFLGCAWRFYILEGREYAKSQVSKMICVCIVATFISSYLSYSWDSQTDEPWQNFAFAYFISIILFIVFTKYIRINSSFMCFLGAISYSLYLVHDPVIRVFKEISPFIQHEYGSHYKILAIISSICIASVLYVIVEKPSIAVGRAITNKIRANYK
ncbi:acyltransferase [Brenneria goodwinii]|uniref:acyltransferase family protein n=1 Tax=Brenneria goodwinii TaxID=1109412 RepID=UPI000EF1E45F|nr:acyltransferase [Brenneria goodwinii]MCG8158731.1 acyltransferase [Brenneria goodwinii]MCG8163254.1 acyltransferase [Brenneria goodwinii]MCG8167675.1 acyltransferase [Brenneria goodwinii]MCG8170581.1 acyltransferase [Brenneria goodwinii]MCG8174419.1 acyltransferase [Brenneria goodwinii]